MSEISWVYAANGEVPRNALVGGIEKESGTIYVGRVTYENQLIPGKVNPYYKAAYVAVNNGKGYKSATYQVACLEPEAVVAWQPCKNGYVPENAVAGGKNNFGQPLYVARMYYDHCLIAGDVLPDQKTCQVQYYGKEYASTEYEVLILL